MVLPVRTRFAPSPNGRLHLGHAYSAWLNRRFADEQGGRFLIRLEDIDKPRCPEALAQAALEDLAWLGLVSDEPVRRQSEHMGEYHTLLARLRERGLIYPCRCSRGDIARAVAREEARSGRPWPRDPDGAPLYPGLCKRGGIEGEMAQGPTAWRLDMGRALTQAAGPLLYTCEHGQGPDQMTAAPERWGDVVLARKDIGVSYHIAVVADDALQGVTHVIRGTDLEAATDLHVLLQRLLDLPTPQYRFHRLITDAQGLKLAKSRGSQALAALRGAGVAPAAILAAFCGD